MNCKQCGAPMVLYRERDYYHCEHCGVYHFPDPTPDGLRILGENPDGYQCPLCQIPLKMMVIDDFYRGYHCSNCRGMMFKRTTFREAIEVKRSRSKSPPDPVNTFNPMELDRVIYCPVCSGQMGTYQYLGPGNIVIDTCHQDDLIWLDYGELNKVINAPGRDRGVPRKKPLGFEEDKKKREKEKRTRWEDRIINILEAFFS
jgi:Zn-finger nucleic acid-binding protein